LAEKAQRFVALGEDYSGVSSTLIPSWRATKLK
jgi:hypothetical protein